MRKNDPDPGVCCPPFDPAPWDDRVFDWEKRKFVVLRVITLFHIPLNFGMVMRKADRAVRASGGSFTDNMGLSDHTSRWNMNILISVDRDVPGMKNITLSGRYYFRVYDGPFSDTAKWCSDFYEAAKSKGFIVRKLYMWYTTCPKCARKYGRNYVAVAGLVE